MMDALMFHGTGGLLGGGMDSGGSRGVSALHKRADQLKRWEEMEAQFAKEQKKDSDGQRAGGKQKQRSSTIKFSEKTLFLASCAINDYEECDRLLTTGLVDINDCNIDGLTALHQACIDDNIEMVQYLIEHGADVNCCDNEGWTPLHATASCGHSSIVKLLLENGADPRIVNNDGELALDIADNDTIEEMINAKLRELNVEDYDLLRKQEQFVMMQDVNEWLKTGVVGDKPHPRSGATILHVAAAKGYISILGTLLNDRVLRSQLDIDALDNEGWTPLHAACYFQQPGAVELLLQKGADIYKKTGTGQSMTDLTDHELILKLIEERKKKLIEEQKLKAAQLANGPQTKVVPPSPPSVPTPPTESETQRKAHAKRARETRRSTQGISADDVNRAKDQLKQVSSNASSEALNITEPINEHQSASKSEDLVDGPRLPSPPSTLPIQQPSESLQQQSLVLTPKSTATSPTSVSISQSPTSVSHTTISKPQSPVSAPQSPASSLPPSSEPSSPDSSISGDQSITLVRRRRPKRRSTGTNPYEALVKGEIITSESASEDATITPTTTASSPTNVTSKSQNGEISNSNSTLSTTNSTTTTTVSVPTTPSINKNETNIIHPNLNRVLNNKPLNNNNEENKVIIVDLVNVLNNLSVGYPATSTSSSSSNVRVRSGSKQSLKESESQSVEKDYRKLYEELLQTYESLKKDYAKREQEWNREKRQMQRRIGELEEECKQLDNFRADNQRLKDENGALIRVISKLSKCDHSSKDV
ncbi:protein phosphatase 1 regulatory subunit 12A-like isoform X4 [Dinothrombium tinctorium]|uniref:Protein phosphatase 1 regulatory subunit 12A-like isoform X4 n=1 Tax=Dinothrombium tinctorium TaxID=1965070 RepID=A0A3S3Q105_9ACAR|nr:protein phosphatase 1 regulatory subunit 12A-like isoform X4 [Dinothrombium tinctorium]RWS11874.1 protein phosphatase 1 regulatory subunit 12A-like isoform X4 [Dinothrombium tinctorium]